MKNEVVSAIYAIRYKPNGQYIRANGKGCWMSISALKSSWRNSWGYDSMACKTFGEGSDYEIVNVIAKEY